MSLISAPMPPADLSSPVLTIGNRLSAAGLSDAIREQVTGELTIPNPKWLENHRMGRWNGRTSQTLTFYEDGPCDTLLLPRGYARRLMLLLRAHNLSWELIDQRRTLPPVAFTFSATLRDFQETATTAMLAKEFGTLNAPTGAGKTVMALAMIAARKQPALIIVHTKDLALQWMERISEFLMIPENEIGLVGAGKSRIGNAVTVGLVQSLVKQTETIDPKIGHLIVDECHRTPSKTFTDVVSAFSARYTLGLSATLFRRDNLSDLIFWYLGDVHHAVNKDQLVMQGDILSVDVRFRKTDFRPLHDPVRAYTKMMGELTADDMRNRMIAEDVAKESAARPGEVMLVLSDRKKHCELLHSLLKYRHKTRAALLTGDLTTAQRKQVLSDLSTGEANVLVATGQLVGEGFDFKKLSTLFLATPIRFSGRLLQYLGRILRPAEGKERASVFDYVDIHVEVLVKAARERQRVYADAKAPVAPTPTEHYSPQ